MKRTKKNLLIIKNKIHNDRIYQNCKKKNIIKTNIFLIQAPTQEISNKVVKLAPKR